LPLEFKPGESAASLGLSGREAFDVEGLGDEIRSRQELTVRASATDGAPKTFAVLARLDSPVEVKYYRNGGILQSVVRSLLGSPH
jgi:aconitate hydratase